MKTVITKVNLKAIRKEKGYKTVKELSEACGIPWRTLESWEEGGLKRAAFEKVDYLSDFLECANVYELFEFKEVK